MSRSVETLRRLKAMCQRRLARHSLIVDVQRRGSHHHFTFVEGSGLHDPVDFEEPGIETIERVLPYTLTSSERLAALCSATEYVVRNRVPGDFVECGVWKGGSMMAVALTLGRLGATDRDLHPFDTFTRMTPLTQEDVDYADIAALDSWPAPESGIEVGAVPASEVREALGITGYADARRHFDEGDVMHTVPDRAPSEIALLRLDTDWYETTRLELVHIYPRLVACRILIVDDNVHFRGATRATDEYFAGEPVYLSRIDYSARLVVKPRG